MPSVTAECELAVYNRLSPEHALPAQKTYWGRARAWVAILLIVPVGIAILSVEPPPLSGSPKQIAYMIAGWVVFCLGGALRWWATLFIGDRKGYELVVDGPYSLCRNPLYLGTFLITLSIGIMLGSMPLAIWTCVVSLLYLRLTLPNEELRLESRFGEEYRNYRRRVPLFFPKLSGYRSRKSVQVNVNGMKSELWRMFRWMWVPICCQTFVALCR